MVASSINSVLMVQETDKLATELPRARCSALTRAALEPTKIIGETLTQFEKAAHAPACPI
jgi:hypothetical protein